jgi:hypothetical protein
LLLAPAKPALSAAATSLIVFLCCTALFIPPLNERVVQLPLLAVALGLAAAVSLVVHLVFVGLAARALGRSPTRWVLLALFTLPLGSIVGLVLVEWHHSQAEGRDAVAQER